MANALAVRVEEAIRRHELIAPGGDVTCLVSGGADSTCLWHVLGTLGYRVSAVHVNHGLRGAESTEDARFCAEMLGAEVVRAVSPGASEAELRAVRYGATAHVGLRATGHTASDQVETILYRLVSSGSTRGIKRRREDGVVRPLLDIWREDTAAYCVEHGLDYRSDSSNAASKRGLIRDEMLPLLRRLHPGAEQNLLALADERPRLPRELERTLIDLLASTAGDEDRRSRQRRPCRTRVRRGPPRRARDVRAVADRERAPRPHRPHAPAGRPSRRSHEEDSGRVRRRKGAERCPRRVADRRLRQRGRGRSRTRGGAWLGRHRPRMERLRDVTQAELDKAVGEVLIEEDAIQSRIGELGVEISADYAGRDLLLVGVLKGAVFFMADLMRELTVPCEIDFMAISSYGAATDSSGVVRILKDLDINVSGRDVLVVEDIIDSGLTLSYLMRNLRARKPASLEVVTLLTKPERREIDVPVRYVGFEIPNRFVIGYGLDFAERYRNLPYVAVLHADLIPPAT